MIAEGFDLEEADLVFLDKSRQFLEDHVHTRPDKPFFLYHAMQAVHLPSLAADKFKGSSGAGPHGDFLVEMDHVIGELLDTLDRLGVADNTLVMFASDNGPEVTTVIHMRNDHGHDGARPWRGMKRDQWEGGHRTPFIVRWPGKVKAGATSDQLTSLTDVMATCAAIVGHDPAERRGRGQLQHAAGAARHPGRQAGATLHAAADAISGAVDPGQELEVPRSPGIRGQQLPACGPDTLCHRGL